MIVLSVPMLQGAMSSMSDFIVEPALRQVRRFSSSITGEPYTTPQHSRDTSNDQNSSQDALSETEEDSFAREGGHSSPPSSTSSVDPDTGHRILHDLGSNRASNSSSLSHTFGSRNVNARDTRLRDPASPLPVASAPASARSHMAEVYDSQAVASTSSLQKALPEDDGMGVLRQRIRKIQASNLSAPEKAKLMHRLLMEGYTKSQIARQVSRPATPSTPVGLEQAHALGRLESLWQAALGDGPVEKFDLTEEDKKPTFAPLGPDEEESTFRALGCEHYKRNVKLQCSTCGRWYTCRFCHDKIEDHPLVRQDTKNMLCMFCGTAQRASDVCTSCGETAAVYYCVTCKLWDNDSEKNIYHCNDCGICRIGRGIGKDFFHCKRCNACLAISLINDHKCIERSLDCNCPICGEYMFNSPRAVCFMKCGHAIHRDCWEEHLKTGYKCPICNKSMVNMETQFRNLDIAIQTQPMPEKFQDTRAFVLCNDCSARTTVRYHWLGLKCAVCHSYNTSQLRLLGLSDDDAEAAATMVEHHELAGSGISTTVRPTGMAAAREIPIRRRHSSDAMQTSSDGQPDQIGDQEIQRLARSASPLPIAGIPAERTTHEQSEMDGSEDEEEDMIGLWSRVPRSIHSNDEDGSADDSLSSMMGDDMDEDKEEEEEEIVLPGHI